MAEPEKVRYICQDYKNNMYPRFWEFKNRTETEIFVNHESSDCHGKAASNHINRGQIVKIFQNKEQKI